MIPGVNIIRGKTSIASISEAERAVGGGGRLVEGGLGCSELLSRSFRGQSTLRKFLGYKEHLSGLKQI